jgi:DNA-binding NtrC family response regulator
VLNGHKYSGTWDRPKVLLVDDEAAVLKALPRVLKTIAPQWYIHVARSGREALEVLERNSIDVLVTDLGMPEMGGIELLEIVATRFPEVTRVAHSADTAALESSVALRHASFRLAKPVPVEQFAEVLDAALAQRRLALKTGDHA